MYLFTTRAIKLISRNMRTNKWTNIYETILFPSLLMDVILETFCISEDKFEVTRKSGAREDKSYQLKQAIPHLIILVLLAIGIFNSIKMTFKLGTPIYSILLFWLVVNSYNVLMSLFFILGRRIHRKAERFKIETFCTLRFNIKSGLHINNEIINCLTYDISETGVSILIEVPEYIPYEIYVDISIRTEKYLTDFQGKIVYVNQVKDKWKYAFIIKKIKEDNYRELLNIIHDRVPDMPTYISKDNSIFGDIRINILKKRKNLKELNIRLPRISLNKEVKSNECGKVIIKNFNYEYVLIRVKKKYKNIESLTIPLSSNIQLKCYLHKDIQNNNKFNEEEFYKGLYKVKNFKSLIKNQEFKIILLNWNKEFKENKRYKQKENLKNEFDEMKYL